MEGNDSFNNLDTNFFDPGILNNLDVNILRNMLNVIIKEFLKTNQLTEDDIMRAYHIENLDLNLLDKPKLINMILSNNPVMTDNKQENLKLDNIENTKIENIDSKIITKYKNEINEKDNEIEKLKMELKKLKN